MYRLGWFSSGRGPGSRSLLTAMHEAIEKGEVAARIEFVFCTREPGQAEGSDRFIQIVESFGIPLVAFSSRKFREQRQEEGSLSGWRIDYDRHAMEQLKGFEPDLCVLAGYMLVVGPEMCRRYDMINLHPAAPGGPAGTWQEVIWQLIESRAAQTGAMMHLVTPELDKGPVVTFCTFPLRGPKFDGLWKQIEGRSAPELKADWGEDLPLFKLIRSEGVKREVPLIITTVKAFAEGRVKIQDKKLYSATGDIISGYDLTYEIEGRPAGAP